MRDNDFLAFKQLKTAARSFDTTPIIGARPKTAMPRGGAGGAPGHRGRDVAGPGLEALPPVPVRRPVRIQVVAVHAREARRVTEVVLPPQLHLGRLLAVPCAAAAAGPHRSGAAAPPAPLGSQLACASAAPPIAPRRGHVEARITSVLLSVASECRKGRPREHGGAPGSRDHADPSPQPEHSDFGLPRFDRPIYCTSRRG